MFKVGVVCRLKWMCVYAWDWCGLGGAAVSDCGRKSVTREWNAAEFIKGMQVRRHAICLFVGSGAVDYRTRVMCDAPTSGEKMKHTAYTVQSGKEIRKVKENHKLGDSLKDSIAGSEERIHKKKLLMLKKITTRRH